MKKILLTIPVVMALTACGAVDRGVASLTGHSVSCVEVVLSIFNSLQVLQ